MTYGSELPNETFLSIINHTPLVAFDLVIRDQNNRILLGWRVNQPAKDTWFVPGGRILKDEPHELAFERISEKELGKRYKLDDGSFLGLFTHRYPNNKYEVEGITTHYVVLAYEIKVEEPFNMLPDAEHSDYRWFSREEVDPQITSDPAPDVHPNVMPYFRAETKMSEAQYDVLNARRDAHNNLLWQTPVLSLTAQAFLFSIILSADTPITHRITAIFLALVTSIASLHLLDKHRFMELWHAEKLQAFEKAHNLFRANQHIRPKNWYLQISSYWVWRVLLYIFFVAAVWNFPEDFVVLIDQSSFSVNIWIKGVISACLLIWLTLQPKSLMESSTIDQV